MIEFNSMLVGAVAMSSVVAGMFFLRFWRDTSDSFFMLFGIAFLLDAAARVTLATKIAEDVETLCLLARLVTYGLIILAIVKKNTPARRDQL